MKPSLVKAWAADLRSGKFPQADGELHRMEPNSDGPAGYCCLGVLSTRICRLKAVKATGWEWDGKAWWARGDEEADYEPFTGSLPPRVLDAIGMLDEDETVFIEQNDGGAAFEQLADQIERKYLGGAK